MTTISAHRPPKTTRRFWNVALCTIAAVVWLALTVTTVRALDGPSFVDIAVVNHTEYRVHVQVSSGDGGWLLLGHVGRDRTETIQEVVDQGRDWIVRFDGGGRTFDVRLNGDELRRARWRVAVPSELAIYLRSLGVKPSEA
jgi:hypothetical protein